MEKIALQIENLDWMMRKPKYKSLYETKNVTITAFKDWDLK